MSKTLYSCPRCQKLFETKRKLNNHRNVHYYRPRECGICGKVFSQIGHLNVHMLAHNEINLFKCEICDVSYRYKHSLNRHIAKVHEEKKTIHKCPFCGGIYSRRDVLRAHIKTKHPSRVNPNSNKCKRGPQGQELYPCIFCKMKFETPVLQERHMRTHTFERPFFCPHCPREFSLNGNLQRHLEIHLEEGTRPRPFKCEVCTWACFFKRDLKLHVQRKHSGVVKKKTSKG